jgi:hypothetical protein
MTPTRLILRATAFRRLNLRTPFPLRWWSIVQREGELRVASYGRTKAGRYLFLAYTMRKGSIRPVTAHTLPRSKRSIYDKSIEKHQDKAAAYAKVQIL